LLANKRGRKKEESRKHLEGGSLSLSFVPFFGLWGLVCLSKKPDSVLDKLFF